MVVIALEKAESLGANIDRRLVPYTRDAMQTKSRIEFIYLFIYLYIYLYICINRGPHARASEFWPW